MQSRKKSAVKQSTEKPILLNFVNLSATFCPRLQFGKLKILKDHESNTMKDDKAITEFTRSNNSTRTH